MPKKPRTGPQDLLHSLAPQSKKAAATKAAPTPVAGPYSFGSGNWPGLAKLLEETGEVQQLIGKIIDRYGATDYWGEIDLKSRFEEELADLLATIAFIRANNDLDEEFINRRVAKKLARFDDWHESRPQPTKAQKAHATRARSKKKNKTPKSSKPTAPATAPIQHNTQRMAPLSTEKTKVTPSKPSKKKTTE